MRSLQGKLRIGTAEQTVLVAIAHSFVGTTSSSSASSSSSSASTVMDVEGEGEGEAEDDDEDEKTTIKATTKEVTTTASSSSSSSSSSASTADADKATGDVPTEPSLMELISAAKETEPEEAAKLRKDVARRVQKGLSSRGLLTKKELDEYSEIAVKRAFSQCPNLTLLITALLSRPIHELYLSCRLIPGVPVAPMLAKPTKATSEVLKRLSGLAFTMEHKYDGERAQIHLLEDGTVKIFSRNSEDNSEKYPDLREVIRRNRCEVLSQRMTIQTNTHSYSHIRAYRALHTLSMHS